MFLLQLKNSEFVPCKDANWLIIISFQHLIDYEHVFSIIQSDVKG